MGFGAGKYDDEATALRQCARAQGVVVIVVGGDRGNGCSVQGPGEFEARLPALLRHLADEIESTAR